MQCYACPKVQHDRDHLIPFVFVVRRFLQMMFWLPHGDLFGSCLSTNSYSSIARLLQFKAHLRNPAWLVCTRFSSLGSVHEKEPRSKPPRIPRFEAETLCFFAGFIVRQHRKTLRIVFLHAIPPFQQPSFRKERCWWSGPGSDEGRHTVLCGQHPSMLYRNCGLPRSPDLKKKDRASRPCACPDLGDVVHHHSSLYQDLPRGVYE